MRCLTGTVSAFTLIIALLLGSTLFPVIAYAAPLESRVPVASVGGTYHPLVQQALCQSETLVAFRNKYGRNWKVLWNEVTKTPTMIYGGSGISLHGDIRKSTLESLSRAFFRENATILGIPQSAELRLSGLKRGGGKWYVSYEQCYHGVPVEGAYAGLVVFDSGQVETIYIDLFSEVNLSTVAAVTFEQASRTAKSAVSFDDASDLVPQSALVIYPWSEDGKLVFYLAWKIYLSCTRPPRDWQYFIDAQNGSVLSSFDVTIATERVYGHVHSYFFPSYGPRDESAQLESCKAESVRVYTESDSIVARGITDSSGDYSLDVPWAGNYKVEFFLKSTDFVVWNRNRHSDRWYKVLADTVLGSTADSTNWEWDYNDSTAFPRYEVNAFHHTRDMLNWIASFPIAFQEGELDTFVKVKVNAWPYAPSICCEGQYGRDSSLVRLSVGNTERGQGEQSCPDGNCENMAYYSDCIDHEVGHAISYHVRWFSRYVDEDCPICEGVADYFASSKTAGPENGEVARYSCLVRDLSNELTYQDDWYQTCPDPPCDTLEDFCPSECHYRGQILSGAFWDIRSSVTPTCADTLVYKSLRDVAATTFEKFCHRMISEDDDDQNPTNKTPHYQQLATAFSNHGLYSPGAPQNLAATADTHSVTLEWNRPQHDQDLVGYKIYYSTNSRGNSNYPSGTSSVDAGDTTAYTFPCLQAGTTYYFSVVSYDVNDDEGAYSNETSSLVLGSLAGVINVDTTWSCSVYITGDVTVGSGATLSITPGTNVRVATSDNLSAGADPNRCELIVNGTIIADGAKPDSMQIAFVSAASSPAANDWRGIRLRPGSTSNLIDNCVIKYAYTGIEAESTTVTVDSCTISSFSNDGIKAVASTVTLTRDSVLVGSTGVRGIELTSGTSGTIDHNTITGSSSGVRYGIEVKDRTDPDIAYNWIEGVKHGIKCTDGYPTIWHDRIKGSTGNGILCYGEAGPSVRYTTIEDFQGTAVSAVDYCIPNLGAYPDSGSNRIYTSQSFSYYVANLAQDPISALYNWWGTSNPSSNKFYGDVGYSPCDASDPGTSYALPLKPLASAAPGSPYVSQSYPNPFNPRTTIEYGVSEPGTRVRIIIYDIVGRAVKLLIDKPHPSGRFSVSWDGRNERAEAVASGVYFYEVTIGDFRQAKKLVVLK